MGMEIYCLTRGADGKVEGASYRSLASEWEVGTLELLAKESGSTFNSFVTVDGLTYRQTEPDFENEDEDALDEEMPEPQPPTYHPAGRVLAELRKLRASAETADTEWFEYGKEEFLQELGELEENLVRAEKAGAEVALDGGS